MATSRMLIFILLIAFSFTYVQCQNLYNPSGTSMRNQTWMGGLDHGLPIREMSIMGTHNSVVYDSCFFITATTQQCQANSLQVQLQSGIRAIDIHVKHKNNMFQVHDRGCAQSANFDNVLTTVKAFLSSYPSETVLLRLVEEVGSSGCSRTFEDTFISYRDAYPGLFWIPTTQDPQLGQVRRKILLLQDFNSGVVHGLLWATFSVLPHKYISTNWDLYSKWTDIKNFLPGVNAARKSKISFWTGHGGSYPYFIVSGKSSKSGSRLSTALTTPLFKNSYPDFPRVACFWGMCSIVFEGMNIMAYNYIVNNNHAYTGIVYTDFYGDDLLRRIVGRNAVTYNKCTPAQVSQGCSLCQLGSGTCLRCNTLLHYVFDPATTTCYAEIGYYLDAAYVPQLCSIAEPGCMECTSAIMCTKCDTMVHYLLSGGQCIAEPGYYLDVNSIPVKCAINGCAECIDATTCVVCDDALNYIIDDTTNTTCKCDDLGYFEPAPSGNVCVCMEGLFLSQNSTCEQMPRCPDMWPDGGCTDCGLPPLLNDTICDVCNTAMNFVFDPTNEYCVCAPKYFYNGAECSSCTVNDAACDQCLSASLCMSCVDNFTLASGVCQCNFMYYNVDNDTCNQCSYGCLVCTDIGACSICDTSMNLRLVNGYCECIVGMYQSNGTCYPCNNMAGCMDCNNAGCTLCDPMFGFHLQGTVCVCDYGFFINTMKVCEQCNMQGCLNCLSQPECIQCDTSLYYLNSSSICDDKCGDGFRFYVDCDDGNSINGDGCSNTCKIETDYTCTGGSMTTPDFCSYSGPFYLTVVRTIKDHKKNKVFIDIVIKPNIMSLTSIDFSLAINPVFPYETKTATFNTNKSQISFEFTYNTSLNHLTSNDLNLTFDPPTSQAECFYMKSASVTMPEVTDNNLGLKYYDQKIYNLLDIMKILTEVTAFLYIGICFICLIIVSKLIAIELILVPQIAFAGLIMIEKIEALLEPLNNFKLTNGYNPMFTDSILLPPRLLILFYQGQFLSNFNICLVVVLLPVLVGIFLLVLGKARKSKVTLKYSYKTLKEWTFSLLLILQFQFTVSFGIDFTYGTSMMGKVIGGLLFAGLIACLVLLYKKPLNFGQFKSYFNPTPLDLNHYIFVVIFRVFLALDLVILSSNKLCGFVACGIIGLYTLFLIIVRPYQKNVRPILNMIAILAILVVQSIYKMNVYSPEATFMTSYLPLFIVALLLVLLLANVIFMILEIKQKYKKKKIDEYQKNEDESFDMEMKKELEKQMEVVNTIQMALNPKNISKVEERERLKIESESGTARAKGYSEIKKMQKQMQKAILLQGTPTNLSQKEKLVYTEI